MQTRWCDLTNEYILQETDKNLVVKVFFFFISPQPSFELLFYQVYLEERNWDSGEKHWIIIGLTVELNRRWQMLQEMMGFFLGGATPKVWLITAFCTGSIYDKKHGKTHMHIYKRVSPVSCFLSATLQYNAQRMQTGYFSKAVTRRWLKPWEEIL